MIAFIVASINRRNWAQKLNFWHFKGFSFMPSYTLQVMPSVFVKRKTLWGYVILASFSSIIFVVVKLKFLKVFRTDSASMKWPFLGSFVCFGLLNMFQSCWHFYQRQSSWIKKMWLENILKVSILAPMGCTQSKIKVKIKGKFLGSIYTQKTKNISKN